MRPLYRGGVSPPRDGDQLLLDLFPGAPWAGRCPRVLTRARLGLIFKPRGQEARAGSDPTQLLFWPVASKAHEKRGPAKGGAPLLLPLAPLRGGPLGRRRPLLERSHGKT